MPQRTKKIITTIAVIIGFCGLYALLWALQFILPLRQPEITPTVQTQDIKAQKIEALTADNVITNDISLETETALENEIINFFIQTRFSNNFTFVLNDKSDNYILCMENENLFTLQKNNIIYKVDRNGITLMENGAQKNISVSDDIFYDSYKSIMDAVEFIGDLANKVPNLNCNNYEMGLETINCKTELINNSIVCNIKSNQRSWGIMITNVGTTQIE